MKYNAQQIAAMYSCKPVLIYSILKKLNYGKVKGKGYNINSDQLEIIAAAISTDKLKNNKDFVEKIFTTKVGTNIDHLAATVFDFEKEISRIIIEKKLVKVKNDMQYNKLVGTLAVLLATALLIVILIIVL